MKGWHAEAIVHTLSLWQLLLLSLLPILEGSSYSASVLAEGVVPWSVQSHWILAISAGGRAWVDCHPNLWLVICSCVIFWVTTSKSRAQAHSPWQIAQETPVIHSNQTQKAACWPPHFYTPNDFGSQTNSQPQWARLDWKLTAGLALCSLLIWYQRKQALLPDPSHGRCCLGFF